MGRTAFATPNISITFLVKLNFNTDFMGQSYQNYTANASATQLHKCKGINVIYLEEPSDTPPLLLQDLACTLVALAALALEN